MISICQRDSRRHGEVEREKRLEGREDKPNFIGIKCQGLKGGSWEPC